MTDTASTNTTTASPVSDLQRLMTYFSRTVRPIEDRSETNTVITGIMRTTLAILAGKSVDHNRLTLDSQLSWFFFDREASRWGMPGWTSENRSLVRALELCATTLNRAAGPSQPLSADEFEQLFPQHYPNVTSAMATRLASDVEHAQETAALTVTVLEQKIAERESVSA